MIVRRIVFAVLALAALATSTGVVIVSAAFGLFSFLRQYLTPAEAAGVITLAAALLAALAAFLAARQAKLPVFRKRPVTAAASTYKAPDNVIDRVVEVARERPFVAAGAAVAAGLLAVANPALVTAAMRAFISPARRRPPPPPR